MADYDLTKVDSLELETNAVSFIDSVALDETHVAHVYVDGSGDCQLVITSHDSDGDNIATVDTDEVNTDCNGASICKIGSSGLFIYVTANNTYGHYWYTYSYDGSYNLSLEDSDNSLGRGANPSVCAINSGAVFCASKYGSGAGVAWTFSIDGSYNISSTDDLTYESSSHDDVAVCMIGDYGAIFYDSGTDAELLTVSFDGSYNMTEEDREIIDTNNYCNSMSLAEPKSGYGILSYAQGGSTGYVKTFSVNQSTGVIATIDSLTLTDVSNRGIRRLALVDDTHSAIIGRETDPSDTTEVRIITYDSSIDNLSEGSPLTLESAKPSKTAICGIIDTGILIATWITDSDGDLQCASVSVEGVGTITITTNDSVVLTLSEISSIQVNISSEDEILPKIVDSSELQVLISSSDELLPKITELSNRIVATILEKSDVILPLISETQQINVSFGTSDNLYVYLEDTNDLINLNTLMNATIRQILGKVEITYSNPFEDEEITISVSNDTTEDHTDLYNLSNSIISPEKKRFNLHNNSLDGTFYPMPSEQTAKNGWWGTTLSDGSGEFTTDPVITFEFDAKTITKLELYGDDKLNNYPVDFTFRLYSAGDVLEHTEAVTGNSSSYWTVDVDEDDIVKMSLTISKISQANSTIKLYEVYTSIVEEYLEDDLFSIELLEELEYNNGTLAIGNISSNEIKVILNNEENIFSPYNEDSPLHSYIKKNRRIQAWLGVEIAPDNIEWHSLGVFWSDDWKVNDNEIDAQVVGLDKLELLRKSDFSTSNIYEDYTLKELAEVVFADAGLSASEYSIDSSLDVDTIPYAWFDRMSHRAALKKIAAAGLAVVYCDREGIIVMEKIDTSGSPLFNFNEDNYFDRKLSTSTEMINYVEVRAEPRILGTQEVIYEDYESFDIPAGESVTKTHFFNFVPVDDAQIPTITAGADISVDSYTAYAWGMEVTYKNVGATQQSVTEIEIQGKKLDVAGGKVAVAQDEDSIAENGRLALPQSISSELIQTIDQAQDIADDLLAVYSDPYRDVRLKARGHIGLKIGDLVNVPEDESSSEYVIVRQHIRWNGALEANVDVQKTGG